jgi:predicted DNA-binding protein (UPF0251 family)
VETRFPKGYNLASERRDLKRKREKREQLWGEEKQKEEEAMKKHKILTRDEIDDIKLRFAEGEKIPALAQQFRCSQNTVWRMCHGMEPKRAKITYKGVCLKEPIRPSYNMTGTTAPGKRGKTGTSGTVKAALTEMVDRAVDARLAGLDACIEAVLERLLE